MGRSREVGRRSSRACSPRLQLHEELAGLRRVALDDLVGQPELHGERDELLLRAVVMLRSSRRPRSWAATSRRRDARSSSIRRTFRRTRPACPRGRGSVRSCCGSSGRSQHRDGERSELLALVPDDEGIPREVGEREGERRVVRRRGGRRGCRPELAADEEPDRDAFGADPGGQIEAILGRTSSVA